MNVSTGNIVYLDILSCYYYLWQQQRCQSIFQLVILILFTSKVITSYSIATGSRYYCYAPLVLCYDRFDHGSREVKHDQVHLVMEDYDITLRWRIDTRKMWVNWHCLSSLFMICPSSSFGGTDPIKVKRDQVRIFPCNSQILQWLMYPPLQNCSFLWKLVFVVTWKLIK